MNAEHKDGTWMDLGSVTSVAKVKVSCSHVYLIKTTEGEVVLGATDAVKVRRGLK